MTRRANMPKLTGRHKQPRRRGAATGAPVRSIGDMLGRGTPILSRIGDQSARQRYWRDWLAAKLSAELNERLTGVAARDGQLTVFAESAAWAARLRYALADLETAIRLCDPRIERVTVRVLPPT